MRLIVVIAGALGFITVVLGSIAWRRPPDVSLVNGILASFVAAILLRWWMRLWITSLEQASRQEELSIKLDQYETETRGQASVTISSEATGPT
jgi:4-amino-4-deoxy-L-arabinose transferase-like glycosyltransferase